MSESKPREMSQIQQEYASLCQKAGHLQYQISAIQKDLELVNSTLRDLNLEAASLNSAAAAPQQPESGAV